MAQLNLRQKFPLMTPVNSTPAMFRLNGCGVALYGSRDHDEETGSYVATWCLALIFVPVLCLRAYRVARSPKGGWYFLGREPLSTFAKGWNLAVIAAILATAGGIQWNAYTSTPAYKARRQMAAAGKLADDGHIAQAAKIYQKLAVARGDQSREATSAVQSLLDHQCNDAKLSESANVYAAAAQVARRGTGLAPSDVLANGLKLVTQKGDSDPLAGVALLNVIRPLTRDPRTVDEQRLPLLKKWVAADPSNVDAVVPLAAALEQRGDLDDAKKLLLPLKDKLTDGDGARVLGTILARQGDLDGAYALLWPYAKDRLDRLHAAESAFESAEKRLWDREIRTLKENKGPADFYEKYQNAHKDRQQAIVQEYVNEKIRNDPEFTSSQEALEREAGVVPVALDLGIVMLQRGQAQQDPEKRKAQLESAEKVFLAIGGIAGETDAYRLSLGKVYYWLGKQEEGRTLFDEFLKSKNRDFASLMEVATKLRELGSEPQARTLVEEAYGKTSEPQERHSAAHLRSLLATSIDDEISWLSRCDTASPAIKAGLAKLMGQKAFNEGRDEEAVTQFRSAIEVYGAMPRSATTLNDSALAYYAIFAATGDKQSFERCADSFQQAVDLSPGDPILLFNAGITLLDGALSDVIGKDIDLHALHATGSTELLRYLYNDQAGRKAVAGRVGSSPALARAMSFIDKTTVLSPKSIRAYETAYEIRRFTQDMPALQALDKRIRAADIDASDEVREIKEFISGAKDQESRTAFASAVKRGEDRMSAARAAGGITPAVALSRQVGHVLRLDLYGQPADIARTLATARQAYDAAPSSGTFGSLVATHVAAAEKDLRAADPAFDGYCKKYERSLGSSLLMAVVAGEPGPFQQKLLANPHFKEVLSLTRKQTQQFPDSIGLMEWACLKCTDPSEAARAADIIRKSDRMLLENSIETLLHPVRPGEALEAYWLMQIHNRPDEGRAAIKRVTDQGIPMPIGS
jgi:hypothetical protein